AKTTSGASATNSFARSRKLSSPAPYRTSTCKFVPGLQPSPCIAFWNAATRAAISASVSSPGTNTPIRRVCGPCCARTTSGHAATPPTSVVKSRRLIASPGGSGQRHHQTSILKEGGYAFRHRPAHVRFGLKGDICSAPGHVRFTPNSEVDCVFRHVGQGPIADAQSSAVSKDRHGGVLNL